jgi:hypothetical protein
MKGAGRVAEKVLCYYLEATLLEKKQRIIDGVVDRKYTTQDDG